MGEGLRRARAAIKISNAQEKARRDFMGKHDGNNESKGHHFCLTRYPGD